MPEIGRISSAAMLLGMETEELETLLSTKEKKCFTSDVKRLLDEVEVQEITGLSYWTLKRYRDKKTLPFLKIGRRLLYEQAGVSDFISKFKKRG